MLISDSHEFVFFHVPKTGGSSLAHALAPYLIKPVEPVLDDTQKGWQGRHHTGPIHVQMSNPHVERLTADRRGHLWVTVTRSPWSKMVSIWHYGCWYLRPNPTAQDLHESFKPPGPNDPSFAEFVRGWPYPQLERYAFTKPQSHWLDRFDDIDLVMDFEDLSDWFSVFCDFVEITPEPKLPHRLKRDEAGKWKEFYEADPELVGLVAEIFSKDVEMLGYPHPLEAAA